MSDYIKIFNANPWGAKVGDCAIRTLTMAIKMSYKEICKVLKVKCINGRGLLRDTGIDLYDIKKKFSEYFDIVLDIYDDMNFVPDEFKNSKDQEIIKLVDATLEHPTTYGISVKDFIDMYANTGRYVVSTVTPTKKEEGHLVYINCSKGFNYAIDIFNSSKLLVDCFMRVKKVVPKDDPRRLKFDKVSGKILP